MTESKQVYKMSDDLIAMIREVVQLSLLTGTNVIDHFRAMQLEVVEDKAGFVTITEDYLKAYNDMILKLNDEVVKKQEELQKTTAVADTATDVAAS